VGGEGQRTQHLRQGRRAQFGRSASAAGERSEPDLVSGLHGVVLTILNTRARNGSAPVGDDRSGFGERQTKWGIGDKGSPKFRILVEG
jgi:hypothetical protein